MTTSNFQFKYPALTKIYGEPNFHSIPDLVQELKAIAQSVPIGVGGGDYGYLPLLLTNTSFLGLPNTTTVALPTNLNDLEVFAGTSQI